MKAPIDKLNIVIVDDEIEACDNLNNILHQYIDASINLLGIANDTIEAEKLVKELKPDAIFLDIEMPDENAFQFLERIYPFDFEVVFVTAYDDFAIKAFRLNAVDYILKPICIEELDHAVQKLKERVSYKYIARDHEQQINVLKQISKKEQQYKITLKSLNHIEIVDFNDIIFIEGQGSYCKISFNKSGASREITTSNSISYYEEILPPEMFYRVHKSYLINCGHVGEIASEDTHTVSTTNNSVIPISRRRLPGFIKFLKENKLRRV